MNIVTGEGAEVGRVSLSHECANIYPTTGGYRKRQKDIQPTSSPVVGAQLVAVEVRVWGVDDLAAADESFELGRGS